MHTVHNTGAHDFLSIHARKPNTTRIHTKHMRANTHAHSLSLMYKYNYVLVAFTLRLHIDLCISGEIKSRIATLHAENSVTMLWA